MKKIFSMGLIACTALSMASCSNDEVTSGAQSAEGDAIEFGTYWGRNAEARGANFTEAQLGRLVSVYMPSIRLKPLGILITAKTRPTL